VGSKVWCSTAMEVMIEKNAFMKKRKMLALFISLLDLGIFLF
jgi:hypothetical protein